MKKSTTSKNFSESKSKVAQFGQERGRSHSEVDLTDIKGSCTDLRGKFESGQAFQREGEDRRRSIVDDIAEEGALDTASKRLQWEQHFTDGGRRSSAGGGGGQGFDSAVTESVRDVKAMFEKGVLNQDTVREYFNQRSETKEDKCKMYAQVKEAFGRGVPTVPKDEDILTERERIQAELEELRESSKNKSRFRLERGAGAGGGGGGLRRANSCAGVSGEVLGELDEDTMKEVSVTQKMVKAMFEQQTAPKVQFGGSGSNLSGSKEGLNKPVVRKVQAKPQDERKWVLDSINKYFDVIVEEEEEEEEEEGDENYSDDEDEYSNEDDDDSDYEYSDDEEPNYVGPEPAAPYQSTSKMRGMLSSVVTNLAGSVSNLGSQEILTTLKQRLGSRSSQLNLAM